MAIVSESLPKKNIHNKNIQESRIPILNSKYIRLFTFVLTLLILYL